MGQPDDIGKFDRDMSGGIFSRIGAAPFAIARRQHVVEHIVREFAALESGFVVRSNRHPVPGRIHGPGTFVAVVLRIGQVATDQ